MRNRRRSRSLKVSRNRKVKPNYTPVIVILCLSIGCGYATAKYVVEPVVNYAPQVAERFSQEEESSDNETADKNDENTGGSIVEDGVEAENSGKVKGYALQFGCYSDKASADSALSSLGIEGATVIEQEDLYKIIGEIYDKKDEPRSALGDLPEGTSAFVTTIYE